MNKILLLTLTFLAVGSVTLVLGQSKPGSPPDIATDVYKLGSRAVRVPPPVTFVEIGKTFDRVAARMGVSKDSKGSGVLAVFVPETFLPRLRVSQDIDLEFYCQLSVSSAAINVDVTKPMFAAVVAEAQKTFSTFMDPSGPFMKRVERNVDKDLREVMGTDPKADITGTSNLGYFEKSPNVFSYMVLATLDMYGRKITTLGAFSEVLAGKRLISVYSYKMFPKTADIAMLKDFQKAWTTAIVAANK